MIRYLVRRTLSALVALILFLFVLFLLIELLVPGDFFTGFRLSMTEQEVEALREAYGVDRALPVRFVFWLRDVVTGGFATTTFGTSSDLYGSIPPTLLVFTVGLWIAFVVGSWLGRVTGWRRGAVSDIVTISGITAYTAFPPFLAFVLAYFLAPAVRDIRGAALGDSARALWIGFDLTQGQVMVRMILTLVLSGIAVAPVAIWLARSRRRAVSGLLIAVGALALAFGWWRLMDIHLHAADLLFQATIPLLAFSLLAFGEFMLITQAGMAAELGEDYVATARAKGLPSRQIRDRHAGRNAILVVVTRLAVSLPYLLTGLIIIERALAWPGLGEFLFRAIESQDIPAVMGALALIGLVIVGVRLALDVLTAVLDPRIRVEAS